MEEDGQFDEIDKLVQSVLSLNETDRKRFIEKIIQASQSRSQAEEEPEDEDYSEIYTPNQEEKPFVCSARPPTPPLHRCPSWESRIYQVAAVGIKSVTSTPTHSMKNSKKIQFFSLKNNSSISCLETVPIFATIHGRASQIRSFALDERVSCSSDEHQERITVTTGTSASRLECELNSLPRKSLPRAVSTDSQSSGDYALPPDAMPDEISNDEVNKTDDDELLCAPMTPKRSSSLQKSKTSKNCERLEKNKYLAKLSEKLKAYHLSGSSSNEPVTAFEHVVDQLMQMQKQNVKGLECHFLWKDPVLIYTKDIISHPLSTLPNEFLKNEALKLFKSMQLFISVPLDSSGIDYHVSLVQNSLDLCLSHSELQTELFFQLIKQTSLNCHHKFLAVQQLLLCASQSLFSCDSDHGTISEKTSPTSSNSFQPAASCNSNEKSNLPNHIFIQAFQFLALAISLFIPKQRPLWLLEQHLHRSADTKTETGNYAIYCQRALQRTLHNGARRFRPSRMEVLGILLRNPFRHSLPHSIPVHLINDSYVVVGFDGSTSIKEFTDQLNTEIGMRDSEHSGFALFCDDPIEVTSLEFINDISVKIADLISKWENVLREKHLGKFENTRVVKMVYKQRLFLKRHIKGETEKERLLLVYQVNSEIVEQRFPVTQELALELVGLLAQIEFGDFVNINQPLNILQQAVNKFYPNQFRDLISTKCLLESIRNKWMELRGRSSNECVRIYLNCVRKWPFCGAALFEAKPLTPLKLDASNTFPNLVHYDKLWITVCDDSLALLEPDTFQIIVRFLFKDLFTFGGYKNDFLIVVSSLSLTDSGSGSRSGSSQAGTSERILFMMSKIKIIEITNLIADYINKDAQRSDLASSDEISNISNEICNTFEQH